MEKDFLHFDLYAALLLTGMVQGFFLVLLFLSKRPYQQPYHHLLLAGVVFTFTCLTTEIFLCYTGLMFKALHLVDFSEPFNFVIGPLVYLLVRSLSGKSWQIKNWLHLLPFLLYSGYHLLFMLQPIAVKQNAYLHAYFTEVETQQIRETFPADPLYLKSLVNELTLLHISIYIVSTYLFAYKEKHNMRVNAYFFSWIKLLLFFYAATLLLFVVVKLSFQADLGDHLMAAFLTLQLFFFSYKMLTASNFFQPVVQVKYEKSALSEETKQDLINKLKIAEQNNFFLQPSASLPSLAKQLHTSPHYLSQALNESLGKSFFEYLAELRIEEAKKILTDPAQQHVKIDEVAELCGYMSKSAFTVAFKKYTGLTPGQYRKRTLV